MEPITARFRWTADEMVRGYRWHQRQRPFFLRYLPSIVAIGFVVVGLFLLTDANGPGGIPQMLFGFFFFFFPAVQLWNFRRLLGKSPFYNTEVEWQITPDRIFVQHPHGKSEFAWSAFIKAVATSDGMLFYSHPQLFHWIPRHSLADADFQRLATLSEAHVRKFKAIR